MRRVLQQRHLRGRPGGPYFLQQRLRLRRHGGARPKNPLQQRLRLLLP
ncbi:hypothetical protein [Streptomyces sp. URMC 124]